MTLYRYLRFIKKVLVFASLETFSLLKYFSADKTGKDADEDALGMTSVKRKLSKCR